MSRLLFPDEGSRLAYRVRGSDLRAVANSTATLYSDAAETILADVRSYDGTLTPGPVIPGSVVTVDAYSRLPLFWGPDGVDTLYAVIYGGPPAPVTARFDERIDALNSQVAMQGAALPDLIIVGVITRDANEAALSAGVVWPDGTIGTYTATMVSVAFPGAVDAYTITYGSPTVRTYTQPLVTRDPAGAVVIRPAVTVT